MKREAFLKWMEEVKREMGQVPAAMEYEAKHPTLLKLDDQLKVITFEIDGKVFTRKFRYNKQWAPVFTFNNTIMQVNLCFKNFEV